MSRRISLIAIAYAGCAACGQAQPWNSQLFPKVNGKFVVQTVNYAGRPWTLDDFSYAGYRLGQEPLGSVPCRKVVQITGKEPDISKELQTAIDTVGAAGGGIVVIPKGAFEMSSAVSIPFDNVSIEGAGSANTRIGVTANYLSHESSNLAEGLFTFGRSFNTVNDGWVDQGPVAARATAAIHRGDLSADVDDTSKIAIGDWVVVQQYFWQALVTVNSHDPDAWPANSTVDHSVFSLSYLRRVTDRTSRQIVLDAPIPETLDPANNPVRIRLTDGKMRQNSGISGLTIRFANNVDPGTGRPHGTAVYFDGVHDGWAYDVSVVNFPRNGFFAQFSARITFLECKVSGAQDKGGNGYGYGFLTAEAQNILTRRCHGEDTRHNFISSRSLTSTIVYNRCVSMNATEPDDTHYGFEQAILWDFHTQSNGEGLTAFNRGDESGGGYETLASGVIWNFHGDGVAGQLPHGGAIYVKPSPMGAAMVIGVNGGVQVYDNSKGNTVSPFVGGDLVRPSPSLQVGTGAGALQNVLYEGIDQPGLDPESLYEAQLLNRIHQHSPGFRAGCPLVL